VTPRTTFWLAAAALFVAAVALPVALVAAVRAGEQEAAAPAAQQGAMQMGGDAMARHMAAVPTEGVPDATASRGGQVLRPRVRGALWTFDLVARPVRWDIVNGTRVTAWTYNGTVPGPELRVPYGQRLRIRVKNELPEPTTVHWHGIAVPNAMDGVPGVTQKPIAPGGRFTYEFRAIPAGRDSKGGTFLYHSHQDEDRQLGLGLAGSLVIEPPKAKRYDVERTVMIAEWNLDPTSGETRPAMDMDGMLPNFFTLNGKSFPATETIRVRRGDRVLLRLIGAGQFTHPMHLHGMDFRVVAKDGHELASPFDADVIQVGSGERYDLAFTATEPGRWIFHCHIGHHMTNDGTSPGGLILVVSVAA
jgi:FtsP/CotA-like multicopper oxidase with cupredoxin domain